MTAKRYTHENCNYLWSSLQYVIPIALESIDIILIKKITRKVWHYMDLYKNRITGKLAEYVAKKYKSHYCIFNYILVELNKFK